MKVRKALITAANPRQRTLPLQMLIDQQGESKSALQIVLEEAAAAGVEEFCVVVCPGDESAYSAASGACAIACASSCSAIPVATGMPCSADVSSSTGSVFAPRRRSSARGEWSDKLCRQLVGIAESEDAPVSAVQPTHEAS